MTAFAYHWRPWKPEPNNRSIFFKKFALKRSRPGRRQICEVSGVSYISLGKFFTRVADGLISLAAGVAPQDW